MIAIIKYNAGNITSVKNALDRLGYESVLTDNAAVIRAADKVIFPGVGEASSAMKYLRTRGLDEVICGLTQPVLGICLGQQLMCRYSEENATDCLGIFDAEVRKFPPLEKVPHIGWNNFTEVKSPIFKGIQPRDDVYFVHSYYAETTEHTTAICYYILPFSAAMQRGNFYATQFHPEKSGGVGERILRNFLELPSAISGKVKYSKIIVPPDFSTSLEMTKNMRIIPAIDIIDGKCVRLTKGDYATKKIYNENPLEVAKAFEANGIEYLHLVDLDGAKSKHIVNYRILEKIASNTNLKIDFGGGLKSHEDVKIAFENGAHQITGGSIAANNPMVFLRWLERYGAEKIILGADCKNRTIATNGWLESSGDDVIPFIQNYEQKGIQYVICTDIAKDGMLAGTSNELYAEILEKTQVKLIASGGVSSVDDLKKLQKMGCEGAILGKAIYENRVSLKELQQFV